MSCKCKHIVKEFAGDIKARKLPKGIITTDGLKEILVEIITDLGDKLK